MQSNWSLILGVIGVLSFILAIIGVFLGVKGIRKKHLICQITESLGIASVIPNKINHRISIIYERESEEPINVKGAYVKFIRIRNIGREPIRREDISSSDPLRIEVVNSRVLDLAVDKISRTSINLSVEPYHVDCNVTTSLITFDFLDHFDGILIRVLTEEPNADILINGTIIGMPSGIEYKTREPGDTVFNIVFMIFFIVLVGMPYWLAPISRYFEFSASISTLIFISVFALFIITLRLLRTPFIKTSLGNPSSLFLPSWFYEATSDRFENNRKNN